MRYGIPIFISQQVVENEAETNQERVCGCESSESGEDFS